MFDWEVVNLEIVLNIGVEKVNVMVKNLLNVEKELIFILGFWNFDLDSEFFLSSLGLIFYCLDVMLIVGFVGEGSVVQ